MADPVIGHIGQKKTHKALTNIEGLWVWNFRQLKNKYGLMLCQSHLNTASETFVRQKENRIRLNFCVFASVAWILIGKDGGYGKTEAKISDSVCDDLYNGKYQHFHRCSQILVPNVYLLIPPLSLTGIESFAVNHLYVFNYISNRCRGYCSPDAQPDCDLNIFTKSLHQQKSSC